MKKKKFVLWLLAASISLTLLGGCGLTGSSDVEETAENTDTAETELVVETAEAEFPMDVEDMFTNRDLRMDYDADEAISIVLSGTTAACTDSSVEVSGATVTITQEGVYLLSGSLTDGMIIVDVEDSEKVQLVLNGVSIANSTSAAIYVLQADKVFVTTVSGTTNTLSNGGEYVAIDDNNIDAVIFSKEDLTLNGEGTLVIEAAAGHGVVSKDDLAITGGTYEITADEHALAGKDSVRIADGSFVLTSGEDAIHSENDEDDEKGYVYIAGGTFTINAGDDGIHAGYAVMIAGGTIDIQQSYEGIEGKCIDVAGGTVSLVSSDDGMNAAGGNDSSGFGGRGESMFASVEGSYIRISGGILSITADGDGIDSNGDLYMTGGYVTISGPQNSGNGSLDYNGSAQITGGTLIAVEASTTMAENFGSSSTQGSILASVSGTSEDTVSLTDSDGNVLVSWTPGRSFGALIISCSSLAQGETYTLTVGDTETEITLTSLIYSLSTGMSGGMGGSMGGGSQNMQNMNQRGGQQMR